MTKKGGWWKKEIVLAYNEYGRVGESQGGGSKSSHLFYNLDGEKK